jgi:excisionase family DNA binding protein
MDSTVRAPSDAGDSLGTDVAPQLRFSFPQFQTKGVPKPMPDDDVLTVREICDLLRVHPSTVYKLLRVGRIPSFRIGNEWRFRKDAIMRWMSEKSMQAREVRASLDSRANGERTHRMIGSGRRKR